MSMAAAKGKYFGVKRVTTAETPDTLLYDDMKKKEANDAIDVVIKRERKKELQAMIEDPSVSAAQKMQIARLIESHEYPDDSDLTFEEAYEEGKQYAKTGQRVAQRGVIPERTWLYREDD